MPWWLLMFCYFFPQAIAHQWKSLANGLEHALLATVHAKFDWDIWLLYGSPLVDLACFIAQIKFLWTKAGGCQRWCGCHMKWLCCWICGRKWENPVKTNSLYSLSSHIEVPLEKSPKDVLWWRAVFLPTQLGYEANRSDWAGILPRKPQAQRQQRSSV